MTNSVPFHVNSLRITGPMPSTEKQSTCIPPILAHAKWPNSWMMMRIESARIARTQVIGGL